MFYRNIFMLLASLLLLHCQVQEPVVGPDPAINSEHTETDRQTTEESGEIYWVTGKDTILSEYTVHQGMVIVEGDIQLGKVEDLAIAPAKPNSLAKTSSSSGNIAANTMYGKNNHWKNARIPYTMKAGFSQKEKALRAISQWNSVAPVVFVRKRPTDENWVEFQDTDYEFESNSAVGMSGGKQVINIKVDESVPVILHEMGHCAGLLHEHQRWDRDNKVDVTTSNSELTGDGGPYAINGIGIGAYDFNSIMHYSTARMRWEKIDGVWRLSENGEDWVDIQEKPGQPSITYSSFLSDGDLLSLYVLYLGNTPFDLPTIQSFSSSGVPWSITRPYSSGKSHFILQYAKSSGKYQMLSVKTSGSMTKFTGGTWGKGWDVIEFYMVGDKTNGIFYNSITGKVRIYRMRDDGKLGSRLYDSSWGKGWDIIRFLEVGSTSGKKLICALYRKSDGKYRIYGTKSNGTLDLSERILDHNMWGYTHMVPIEDLEAAAMFSGSSDIYSPTDNTGMLFYSDVSGATLLELYDQNGSPYTSWFSYGEKGYDHVYVFDHGEYKLQNSDNDSRIGSRNQIVYYNSASGVIKLNGVFPKIDIVNELTSPGYLLTQSKKVWANAKGVSHFKITRNGNKDFDHEKTLLWYLDSSNRNSLISFDTFPFPQ